MTTTATAGLVLNIDGKEVLLAPRDVSDALKKGARYTLAERVSLGTPGELVHFLEGNFGASGFSVPSLPAPLDSIAGKLANLNVSIEKFDLTIPPSKDDKGVDLPEGTRKETSFTIGMAAVWSDDEMVNLIPGKLAVKGVYLQVVKDDAPSA
ncbi:hypothetical protein ABZ671_13930 [Micromonospora sp. NPDC006766]|uniref:hypothetical protein n=1 Tax=Micromonospora sp. NPDC006766 TaxID=3154778 RepID=UPI0033FC49E5